MLPQALLFTSDQQVAEVILALLPEFGMEVEHCADVFGAIQRITGRPYQLLIVDWKEHLEAGFLLKTARELKLSHSTPAIAVVEQNEVAAALKVGADAVLVKPLTFDQARNTIQALPAVSRKQPSPPQISRPKALVVPSGESRLGLESPAPRPQLKPVARLTRASTPKPLSFAGYAHNPRRPSGNRIKHFVIAVFTLGAVGLLIPVYTHVRGPVQTAIHQWRFTVKTGPQAHAGVDSTIDAEAIAEAAMSDSLLPSMHRGGTHKSLRSRVVVEPVAGSRADAVAELLPSAVRPVIPNSLSVPVLAMTSAAAPQTRLTPAPANKWSLDPVLVPEEISRGLLERQVIPQYPQPALSAGIQGTVLLHALVGKDGTIRDLKLVRGPLVFGRSAFEAVKGWRFKPYHLNGEIVEMQTFITVNFSRSETTSLAQTRP